MFIFVGGVEFVESPFVCFNSTKVVGVGTNFGFKEGGWWMGMGFKLKRLKAQKKMDKTNIAKPTSYHNYSYIYKKSRDEGNDF